MTELTRSVNDNDPAKTIERALCAKHRNGGLDNIRLKFIAHLGKFEDMDTFDTPFEFQSKMNPMDGISSDKFPNPDDIFDQLDEDDETESSF